MQHMDYVNQPPLASFYSSLHSYRLKERGRESEFNKSEKESEKEKELRRGRAQRGGGKTRRRKQM